MRNTRTICDISTKEDLKNDLKKEIRVYLDSQAALIVILRPRQSSALIQECRVPKETSVPMNTVSRPFYWTQNTDCWG